MNDVDLTRVDPNLLDGEFFALKTIGSDKPVCVSETNSMQDFDIVASPDKKVQPQQKPPQIASKKKKKFVKRLVPRPKNKQKQEGSSDSKKGILSGMRSSMRDMFSVDGFSIF